MKKKFIAILMTLALTIGTSAFTVFATAPTKPSGSGTESDPYIISTPDEFAYFAANCDKTEQTDVSYKLASDFVVTKKISGINSKKDNKTKFDGNNVKLSTEYCNFSFKTNYGTIKNIVLFANGREMMNITQTNEGLLENIQLTNGKYYGKSTYKEASAFVNKKLVVHTEYAYAGFSFRNKGTIKNCETSLNDVSVPDKKKLGVSNYSYHAAGITIINEGTIDGCVNNSNFNLSRYGGGICAVNTESGKIINTENKGEIEYEGVKTAYAPIDKEFDEEGNTFGGFANVNKGIIENSTNSGYVKTSTTNGTGGLVGVNLSGSIVNCKNILNNVLTVKADRNEVGGIAGINKALISKCVNEGNITGKQNVGGIVGANFSKVENCLNKGNVHASEWAREGAVAGICGTQGDINNASDNFITVNSINTGKISIARKGRKGYAQGGIIGFNNGKVDTCFNLGLINGGDQMNTVGQAKNANKNNYVKLYGFNQAGEEYEGSMKDRETLTSSSSIRNMAQFRQILTTLGLKDKDIKSEGFTGSIFGEPNIYILIGLGVLLLSGGTATVIILKKKKKKLVIADVSESNTED